MAELQIASTLGNVLDRGVADAGPRRPYRSMLQPSHSVNHDHPLPPGTGPRLPPGPLSRRHCAGAPCSARCRWCKVAPCWMRHALGVPTRAPPIRGHPGAHTLHRGHRPEDLRGPTRGALPTAICRSRACCVAPLPRPRHSQSGRSRRDPPESIPSPVRETTRPAPPLIVGAPGHSEPELVDGIVAFHLQHRPWYIASLETRLSGPLGASMA